MDGGDLTEPPVLIVGRLDVDDVSVGQLVPATHLVTTDGPVLLTDGGAGVEGDSDAVALEHDRA